MKSKIICLIFILLLLLLIPFSSSSTLGISPGTIEFFEEPNQIICKNFTIFADNDSLFYGEVKWSKENSKNINQYTLSSEELNINTNFPNKTKSGQYQICLSVKKEGNYFGALMYKLKDSSYGIGSWIELSIAKNNSMTKILLLTGNAINKTGSKKIFFLTPILLLIILILLLSKLKKRKNYLPPQGN